MSIKKWAATHNGHRVNTIQKDLNRKSVWVPGVRTLNADRATYMTLDGSRSDYRGLRTVAQTDTSITLELRNGFNQDIQHDCVTCAA